MTAMTRDDSLYRRALEFAAAKHSGQLRIGGDAYITHPIAVAEYVREWGYGTPFRLTALFHDLLEDTDASEDEILQLGGEKVLEAVKLLTKRKGYVMSEYMGAVKKNEIARVVKAADRLHNLRCASAADTDFKRRYILETVDWYLDLSPEIPKALKELVRSLDEPLAELELLYDPIETWKTADND